MSDRSEWKDSEPEVIIKKSGGTWVARYDGVDYLCLDVDMYSCEEDIFNEYKCQHPECMDDMWKASWWSPISEIKITDEIAHLHPMVKSEIPGDIVPLLAVRDHCYSCGEIVKGTFYITEENGVGPMTSSECDLATVEDLP